MMMNVRMYIDVDVAAGSENSGTFVCALAGGTLLTGSSTDRLKNENCCIVSFSTIVSTPGIHRSVAAAAAEGSPIAHRLGQRTG